jgi:hypothetical protein
MIKHEPLEANGLELFQVLGEVLGHPAAVDPHQEVDTLVHAGRADTGLVDNAVR